MFPMLLDAVFCFKYLRGRSWHYLSQCPPLNICCDATGKNKHASGHVLFAPNSLCENVSI